MKSDKGQGTTDQGQRTTDAPKAQDRPAYLLRVDERRDEHVRREGKRLRALRDNGGSLTVVDIEVLIRRAFTAGAVAMSDACQEHHNNECVRLMDRLQRAYEAKKGRRMDPEKAVQMAVDMEAERQRYLAKKVVPFALFAGGK